MKLKAKARWKALPLSHTFYSAGGMDQAVCGGIEELTDYTLLSKGKKEGKVKRKTLSAPPMKGEERMVEVKKRKVEGDLAEEVSPSKKSKKRNTFNVVDVDEEEKDFLKLSRSQVVEEDGDGAGKKKKKKRKSAKNKPAINLAALGGISSIVEEKEDTAEKEIGEKQLKKESGNKSQQVGKENTGKKKTLNEKTEKIREKKQKKKANKNVKELNDEEKVESKTESSGDASDVIGTEDGEDNVSEWKKLFVCEALVSALEKKGFKTPTPIQRLTLPAAIKGKMDIVGAAETGSGKTLAFGLPIIQGILEDREYERKHGLLTDTVDDSEGVEEEDEAEEEQFVEEGGIGCVAALDDIDMGPDMEIESNTPPVGKQGDCLRALIVTPTRELAIQIQNHLASIASSTGVGVVTVVGGMSVEKQLRLLKRKPAIVVGTPGRLWDLVQEGNPHLSGLASIRYLAIDETDRMAEKGHFEELQRLLEMANSKKEEAGAGQGRERQTFIMSATLAMVHKPPKHAKKQKQKSGEEKIGEIMTMVGVRERRKVVDITRKTGTAETLSESVLHCGLTEKDFYLYYFVTRHSGRTVVFCNSIDCVRRLTNLLGLLSVTPLPLHAQLHQKQRLKNLDRFTASSSGLLIATDVAARGLDIPNIQHVVHYQVPRTSEGYVHRSGRTARATKAGLSLLLVEPGEVRSYQKLLQTLARSGTKDTTIPTFPVDEARLGAVRERVNAARKLDKMLLANRKAAASEGWLQKAAEEADLIVDGEDDSDEEFYQGQLQGKGGSGVSSKQEVAVARAALNGLLATPLDQAGYCGAYPTMGGLLPNEVLAPIKEDAVESLEASITSSKALLKGNPRKKKVKKIKHKKKNISPEAVLGS